MSVNATLPLHCPSSPHLRKRVVIFAPGEKDVDDAEGADLEVLAAELAIHGHFLPTRPTAVGSLAMHSGDGRVMGHLKKYKL